MPKTRNLHLLPLPRRVEPHDGFFPITSEVRVLLPAGLERPEWLAAGRLLDAIEHRGFDRPRRDRDTADLYASHGMICLHLGGDVGAASGAIDSYRLSIRPGGVDVVAAEPAGLLAGIETLNQIVRQAPPDGLPCLEIMDDADFRWRGVYLDISRGRIYTLETLKELVDDFVSLKVNMLQLYVEHVFAFRFDPEIAHGPDALTSDEVLELQEYCRDRRIALVPSLQSFGHMAGVLSLPQYRHFAEVDMPDTWENLTWRQRLKGATLDTGNPEALALLERMTREHVTLFDAPFGNPCADETYDLGKGRTAALAGEMGVGRLYLRHITWLRDLYKRHGKTMMFWGDIIKKYPDLVPEIPRDTILMHWGYHENTDYATCELFAKAGLNFFVCPGTSGWNRLLNGIDNADKNIRRFAAAGKQHGAMGLLNTDWGDYGHYNMIGASMHGLVLGAAMAWNVTGPDANTFDRGFARLWLGDEDNRVVPALRSLSFAADDEGTWELLRTPVANAERFAKLPPDASARLVAGATAAREALLNAHDASSGERDLLLGELLHAVRMVELLGRKIALVKDFAAGHADAKALDQWADAVEDLIPEYETLWMARCKPSDIGRVLDALRAAASDARGAGGGGD